ncbi:MAG: acyl carrier protein [Lawsonella sp.]|nr:acyl carrier protein [Mycobacteriales bacterium]
MAPNEQDIVTGLAEIVEEVTGVEPAEVTLDKKLVDDLDIDSLSMVEIAVQTEDKYGIEIPDEKMKGLRTVRDVVQFIRNLNSPTQ